MFPLLYLDTARLGQVSPSAKRALTGALELNQALGASAYFDTLLHGGTDAISDSQQFDGLEVWQGIEQFKYEIKRQFFGSANGQVVLASRTASLMSIAAKMLFARCRNVLVTDLNWNSFSPVLSAAIPNPSSRITEVRVKDLVFNRKASAEEVTQTILKAYVKNKCDGIFLPAVSHHGVRLPVESIVGSVRENAQLRFSVVDAGQAINHIKISGIAENVDFLFAGTHKWLRSYEPMAVGYFSLSSSASFVSDAIGRELKSNPIADPLVRISGFGNSHIEETINLCPLFAAAGAVRDARKRLPMRPDEHTHMLVRNIANKLEWNCLELDPTLRSRIVLLRKSGMEKDDGGTIRATLMRFGIAATDYAGGLCRISLPETLSHDQARQLEKGLHAVV